MNADEQKEVRRALRGLLKIAEMAMPDTFFATDSRVRAAKKLLKKLASDPSEIAKGGILRP